MTGHPPIGRPYDPDRPQLPEDRRAILCSIWAGDGSPVRNPRLAEGCQRVGWGVGEEQALNLAEREVREGTASGNPAAGYTLTDAGERWLA